MYSIRINKVVNDTSEMKYEKLEIAKLKSDEIGIKIVAAGVNFIDTYHRTGLYKVPLPFTLGREGSGIIDKIGDDVKRDDLKIGDKVCFFVQGTYSTYVNINASRVIKVPKELDCKIAAASLLQGLTSHYLTHSSYEIKKGDSILVHAGAGGCGGIIIQMAKLKGATVYTTVSTQEKAKICKKLGADHVILYNDEKFDQVIEKLTDGKGVQCVYDGVGLTTYKQSMKSVAVLGSLVLFGNASGAVPPINPLELTGAGSISLQRPSLKHYVIGDQLFKRSKELFDYILNKQVTIRIAKEFKLEEAAQAHEYLQGRKALGKIVLVNKE